MSVSHTFLVSGANSDIGIEVCRQSIDAGNKVIALFHNQHKQLDELGVLVGDRLQTIQIDFSDTSNIEKFIKNHSNILNEVDVFISLATFRKSVPYGKIYSADLLSHFTVNVIPVVLLIQFLGESMMRKGWGRIVLGSSIGVKFGGGYDSFCYSLTKFASEFIPNIAKKWSQNNVLYNVLRIGVTDSSTMQKRKINLKQRAKLIPMQRLAQPKEIAKQIHWLASEENTFVTNQVIAISGGE